MTAAQWLEQAEEPLRTFLLENKTEDRKIHYNETVPNLKTAINYCMNYSCHKHEKLIGKLLSMPSAHNEYFKIYEEVEAFQKTIKPVANGYLIDNGRYSVIFNVNTFGNCQTFTIGAFQNLLQNGKKHTLYALDYFFGLSYKQLAVVDVTEKYVPKVKEYLEKQIVLEAPYKSSNGSNMTIFIINASKVFI